MVMLGPHCLDMLTEYDQIHFPSQHSHPNLVFLIENSSFQVFWGFEEDCFKFHDPIYDCLEESYLASSLRIFGIFSCLLRRMAQMKVH